MGNECLLQESGGIIEIPKKISINGEMTEYCNGIIPFGKDSIAEMCQYCPNQKQKILEKINNNYINEKYTV